MSQRINLSKKAISDLPTPPAGKRAEYYDTQVRGLMVRVSDKGHKAYYARRKQGGKSQRLLIGEFPETPLEEARKKALELCAAISRGNNPRKKTLLRAEPTLGELLEAYLQEHARPRCLAAKEIEAVFRRYIRDWRDRKLMSISAADVQRRLNEIAKRHGKVPANHTLTYARAAINWCIKNALVSGENPWVGVKKFKTQPRERYLKPEELEKFFRLLKDLPNDSGIRDYIYISLFTGARKANVLGMRWEQIDFDLAIWTIPLTKSGDSQTLPLPTFVLELLIARHANRDSEWVFPGKGKTGHLVEPKMGWYNLLKAAEIEGLRIHDLRRTLGSYMAMGNQSLHMIGKVLGHKSPTATQIYSRLAHDPIRQAMEKAQNDMLAAAGLVKSKKSKKS
jgi:integrase